MLPEFAAAAAEQAVSGDTEVVDLNKMQENLQNSPTVGGMDGAAQRSRRPTVAGIEDKALVKPSLDVPKSQRPTVASMDNEALVPTESAQVPLNEESTLLIHDTRPEMAAAQDDPLPEQIDTEQTEIPEEADIPTVIMQDLHEVTTNVDVLSANGEAVSAKTKPDFPASNSSESGRELETQTELQIDDDILIRPLSATTVREFEPQSSIPWLVVAVLIATVVGVAVYIVGARTATEAESRLVTLANDRAAQQTQVIMSMISAAMNAGRPDLARRGISELNHRAEVGLSIVRPNRTRAFVSNDMEAYRAVLGRVCANKSAVAGIANQWLVGRDEFLRRLGGNPCDEVERLTAIRGAKEEGISDDIVVQASKIPYRPVHWLDRKADHSEHFYVTAIANTGSCNECHGAANADNAVLGFVVIRTDLSVIDNFRASTLQSTFLVAGGTLLVTLLLLLAGARVARRRNPTP
jgi:hypothetical protein